MLHLTCFAISLLLEVNHDQRCLLLYHRVSSAFQNTSDDLHSVDGGMKYESADEIPLSGMLAAARW